MKWLKNSANRDACTSETEVESETPEDRLQGIHLHIFKKMLALFTVTCIVLTVLISVPLGLWLEVPWWLILAFCTFISLFLVVAAVLSYKHIRRRPIVHEAEHRSKMKLLGIYIISLGLVFITVAVALFSSGSSGSDYLIQDVFAPNVSIPFIVGFIITVVGMVLFIVGRKREKRGITPPDETTDMSRE